MTLLRSWGEFTCSFHSLYITSDDDMSTAVERILREEISMDNMQDIPSEVVTFFEKEEAMNELMKFPFPIPLEA